MARLSGRSREPDSLAQLVATGLALARLAIGAGIWLAPRRALQALGFNEPSGEALLHSRIAASRDLVLGAWQLRARADRRALAQASTAVAVADAGDALAFGLALGSPAARRPGMRGLPAAACASVVAAWLAARVR